MTRSIAPQQVAAATVWAVSWGLALSSLVIAWVFRLRSAPVDGAFLASSPLEVQSQFDDIGVVIALLYGPLAALLIARRPHPVAAIVAVHAVGSGLAAFGVQYGLLGEQYPGLPLWEFFLYAAGWGYIPGTIATTVIPLLITARRKPSFHRVLIIAAATSAAAAFFVAVTQQPLGGPSNPFGISAPGYQEAARHVYEASAISAVVISSITGVIIVGQWLQQSPRERAGLGWLVLGHLFLTASYAALVIPDGTDVPTWVWDFGVVAPVLGQVFYPAAILVMVLGRRLWGIDVAVHQLLVALILTFAAISSYLLLVGAVDSFFAAVEGGDAEASGSLPQEWVGFFAAVVVALALQPARSWLLDRVGALVYQGGPDRETLVRTLGERVGELETGSEGLASLAQALRSSLRLGSVSILPTAAGVAPAVAGFPEGPSRRVDLLAGTSLEGTIVITARPGERLRARDVRTINELAGVVSATVQLAAGYVELEHAREDVLAARQAARRSIRQELHDGIGPALAGIGFGLAAVDNLIDHDVPKAEELLTRFEHELRGRLADVRELADSMRQPSDERDLESDLEDLAVDFSHAGPFITVHAPAALDLDAAARQATYLIVSEALHNAVRHAGATRIDIELDSVGDRVVLSVVDDGVGFDGMPRGGIGLASMREHGSAVGARVTIESSTGGGTSVMAIFEPSAAEALTGATGGTYRG